ncbi:MAG: hypothetical protein AAF267_21970 [Deinococcota bacterium]
MPEKGRDAKASKYHRKPTELFAPNRVWVIPRLAQIKQHQGTVFVRVPQEYGVVRLVAELAEDKPNIWLHLDAPVDDVSLGNKLADAVHAALHEPLFGYGLGVNYGLALLKKNLRWLGEVQLSFTGAGHAPDLAQKMLALHDEQCQVVVASEAAELVTFSTSALVLTEDDLRLTRVEAEVLVEGKLEPEILDDLLEQTDGALESFLTAVHTYLKLPPPDLPTPTGKLFNHDDGLDNQALLRVLMRRNQWVEALELAVTCLKADLPEVLATAGHHYFNQGLQQKLHDLLDDLPDELRDHPTILFWRFAAANRLERSSLVRSAVKEHLNHNDAAELRALYAGTLTDTNEALQEAKRAYETSVSPLTAHHYGWRHPDDERSVELLHQALLLAEKQGHGYEIAGIGLSLCSRLIHLGRYRKAVTWGRWALSAFDQQGLGDVTTRVGISNSLAYA